MPVGYHITILATGASPSSPLDTDSGTATETFALAFTVTDTGSSIEATTVGGDAAFTESDSATATETPALNIIDYETGTATETPVLAVLLDNEEDTGTGTDVGGLAPQSISDLDSDITYTETGITFTNTIIATGIASRKWRSTMENKWTADIQRKWKGTLVTNEHTGGNS